jgi:NADPH:quinone reductase-like Zn-dependent oxidoreductase
MKSPLLLALIVALSLALAPWSFADTPPAARIVATVNGVEASKLRVPVAAEYSLAQAAEAHKRLDAGHLLGKIVLLAQ